ncbi:hypothetical protein HZU73_05285 [Apis mellifera caucasica]|nr:hypothetical protein HZU73_05285 [Apis mellifera caucasica]KAG9433884.1 hypothetical protein HZU67_04435 [Apis mellifera carnica]
MSSSGYRGRNFGPRGTHINGPTNGFNGPRFPHPSFNHPRPLHRLSGPDKWIERANFAPWQQNKNFLPHPQYRGNLQFRPNNRGRTTGRGILRFSGPGRPSTAQFCMGFIRNPIHRPPLLQEEQDGDKPILISQTPLLGSEEERQQKILETADKLKQKLSSITEEELTNFWEDDLSVLPNNSSEEENIRNKGIPELSHEPPELDLTFTDFRDIGRVDCINSKFENVDIEFDPRAPPPSSFMHNVPISNHEFQQTAIVSFNNLPPTFNPNAPPPNIRPKSNTELSQEWLQPISSLDLRGQAINTQSNLKIIQPSSVFDPRRLPPRISNIPITINEKVSEFNPQQPPPKIHRREKTLQPPPIFDPRLSFQERSNLIAPLNISRSNMIPFNLIETSPVSDFKISPVTQNFSQPPPINISSHQTFISNVQVNFQSVVSQTSNEQEIIREFSLPLPPISITELPPPPPLPKEPLIEKNSNPNQNINMDDGLEDMQEAMEFAKQIMNLSEEIKNNDTPSTFSELSLTPSKIPIPNEISSYHSLSIEETNTNITKKQKKKENKNKKCRQNVIYGPELIFERQEDITTIDEKQNLQNQNKKTEDILLSNDQIRPKVIFNLNSKTKRIHKPEDWHKISINISDNKEISQQKTTQNSNKEKDIYNPKKHYEIRNNQNKNQQKEIKIKKNSIHSASLTNISHEKSNDTSYHYKNYTKDIEKLKAHSSNMITFNNIITPKNQITNSKKESKKQNVATSESLWKNRVISRFLKMSKNDICNMVNNSSLRKFDIVMRHLVKERRSSLSLELRNTEDEKMKEYDREEFMNQLNAMLDPSTVVGITDLPTEFIHHLSEVLQLDPMPFDIENQNVNDEIEIINQNENLKINTCEYANEENLEIQSFTQQPDSQNIHEEKIEDNFLYNNEESIHYSLNTELNLNTSQEDTNLSHRSISNNINSEIENVHKKQPLFNEADLDDILSEVTEKTKNLPNTSLSIKSEKFIETCTGALSIQRVTKTFDSNIFSQIPTKTEADLDVIFSAGIARVKQLGKNKINLDNLRASKSNFEDRNTFKSERYERWNRKEDPDTFRNLTKEEWEAKYGIANIAISPTIIRKNVFNSDENLIKDKNCSSDSPMRYLSISPLTHEISTYNVDKCISDPDEIEELQNIEGLESNGESSLTSSSDTDEETVASNVTKLLKVIKEKEKIAKKKSLNETIRDEITAEIEKKWKEKSKHKEKKSRKHGKRKKDKKDKRRREKRKKKKRSCYSDSSKFSEKIERSRLLTKDEIKKEVIIKQEQTKSEENASFNNEINNTMINKPDIEIVEEKMKVIKNQQYNNCESTSTSTIDMTKDKELPRTQYTVHKGPILDIKVFENSFLAASEDGRIYRYNQASNGILNIYKGHKAAVTCLYVYNANNIDINKEWMFSGSLDGTLRCYNIMTGIQIRDTADISSPIQCMDEAWGIIFIGTKSGHVSRYHMKSGVIKGNSIQFSDKSVLALKATNEGPRRVLIVASRNQPITIRDAQNGLFLRTICGQKSHTVYSLMRDYNLIYCGTSSTSIPVFDFTNGEQTMQYNAGVGIVCMRLYKKLLFAGCYDGNIYVFDTKDHRLVCSIPGPGNMLLSMEVIDNKIIAGSKDKRLQSWQMPRQVLSLLLNQI